MQSRLFKNTLVKRVSYARSVLRTFLIISYFRELWNWKKKLSIWKVIWNWFSNTPGRKPKSWYETNFFCEKPITACCRSHTCDEFSVSKSSFNWCLVNSPYDLFFLCFVQKNDDVDNFFDIPEKISTWDDKN